MYFKQGLPTADNKDRKVWVALKELIMSEIAMTMEWINLWEAVFNLNNRMLPHNDNNQVNHKDQDLV